MAQSIACSHSSVMQVSQNARTSPLSSLASVSSSHKGTASLASSTVSVASTRHSSSRRLVIHAAKRVSSGRSLVLSSTLVSIPGKENEVVALCTKLAEWVQGEKKSTSGILHFEWGADAHESNVIHCWERFDSFPSMNRTHSSPEYTKFMEEVRPLLEAPIALAAYEYKDGQIGCMLNPIGPKGEGGLDDATGQGGSGGGASYKQTSQSVMQGLADEERGSWGIEKALELSGKNARLSAEGAAAAIAKGLKSIFGQK